MVLIAELITSVANQVTINEHGLISQEIKETLPEIIIWDNIKIIKVSGRDKSTDELIEEQLIVTFITIEHYIKEIYRNNKQIEIITLKTLPLIPAPNQAVKPVVLIDNWDHKIKPTS